MKDLGSNARELLDNAKRADSAPEAHLGYGRNRLMATLAAGAVTASALGAKGALLGAAGAANTAAPVVGTAASLVTTLVSAVTIGLSAGLIAVSPATRNAEPPRTVQVTTAHDVSANVASHLQVGPNRGRVQSATSEANSTPSVEVSPSAPAPTAASPAAVAAAAAPPVMAATDKPTRASIALETALLADVQRALKSGRAAMALDALDRYTAQCPERLLLEEATVSRVLTLCALGRVQDARRWADEFMRRYPTSPLLPRVQGACLAVNQRSAEAAPATDRGRDDL